MPGAAADLGAAYSGRRVSASAAFGRNQVEEDEDDVPSGFEGWNGGEDEGPTDGGGGASGSSDLTSSDDDGEGAASPSPSPPPAASHDDADLDDEEAAFAAAEREDAAAAAALARRAAAEAAKGEAVDAQQRVWGRALEARILLQRALAGANRLPRPAPFGSLKGTEEEDWLAAEAAGVADSAAGLAAALWGTAEALLASAVAARGTGDLPPPGPWSPLEEESPSSKQRKRRRSDWLWERGEAAMAASAPFRDAALDRWHRKAALLGGGKAGAGLGLRALGQPPSAQVAAAMADAARLLDRARLPVHAAPRRVACDVPPTRVACGGGENTDDDEAAGQPSTTTARDPDTYDDGEFYSQLLKEFVEAASGGAAGGGLAGARAGAAARRRKTVDRRASKGRKLRFDVHEKLVGFMAPDDRAGTPPLARQLAGALFGGGGG